MSDEEKIPLMMRAKRSGNKRRRCLKIKNKKKKEGKKRPISHAACTEPIPDKEEKKKKRKPTCRGSGVQGKIIPRKI